MVLDIMAIVTTLDMEQLGKRNSSGKKSVVVGVIQDFDIKGIPLRFSGHWVFRSDNHPLHQLATLTDTRRHFPKFILTVTSWAE